MSTRVLGTAPVAAGDARTSAPSDVSLPHRASSLAATRELVRLLARPTLADRPSWGLPVVAMAVVNALSLSVAGGVGFFLRAEGELAGFYMVCAVTALVLLLIPLMTLAAAAARLSASRRDQRLSSLRLVGATSATITLVTLAETAAVAAVGAVLGVVGHLALMPLFGLLPFMGGRIGASALWLGVGPVAVAVLALTVLALVSSAVGLRRVVVSPLGVRTREKAPHTSRLRAIGAVLLMAGGFAVVKLLGVAPSEAVAMAMGVIALCLPILAIVLVGPWVIQLIARRDLKRARTSAQLLAARSTLENPKQLWRQIGALPLTVFVGILVGVGMTFAQGQQSNPQDVMLTSDLRTGALLTLALSFVTVACSVGINQSGAVLDRRGLYVGLDMVGMPRGLIERARRRSVMRPLVAVVAIAAFGAMTLVAPLGLASRAADPLAIVVVGAVILTGVAVVWLALVASHTTLRQVLQQGLARSE